MANLTGDALAYEVGRLLQADPDLKLSPNGVIALLGNAGTESAGFTTGVQFNGGPGRGLWQWDGERARGFNQYLRDNGYAADDYMNPQANVGYLKSELLGSEGRMSTYEIPGIGATSVLEALRNNNIPHAELTDVIHQNFERPADTAGLNPTLRSQGDRQGYATRFADYYNQNGGWGAADLNAFGQPNPPQRPLDQTLLNPLQFTDVLPPARPPLENWAFNTPSEDSGRGTNPTLYDTLLSQPTSGGVHDPNVMRDVDTMGGANVGSEGVDGLGRPIWGGYVQDGSGGWVLPQSANNPNNVGGPTPPDWGVGDSGFTAQSQNVGSEGRDGLGRPIWGGYVQDGSGSWVTPSPGAGYPYGQGMDFGLTDIAGNPADRPIQNGAPAALTEEQWLRQYAPDHADLQAGGKYFNPTATQQNIGSEGVDGAGHPIWGGYVQGNDGLWVQPTPGGQTHTLDDIVPNGIPTTGPRYVYGTGMGFGLPDIAPNGVPTESANNPNNVGGTMTEEQWLRQYAPGHADLQPGGKYAYGSGMDFGLGDITGNPTPAPAPTASTGTDSLGRPIYGGYVQDTGGNWVLPSTNMNFGLPDITGGANVSRGVESGTFGDFGVPASAPVNYAAGNTGGTTTLPLDGGVRYVVPGGTTSTTPGVGQFSDFGMGSTTTFGSSFPYSGSEQASQSLTANTNNAANTALSTFGRINAQITAQTNADQAARDAQLWQQQQAQSVAGQAAFDRSAPGQIVGYNPFSTQYQSY